MTCSSLGFEIVPRASVTDRARSRPEQVCRLREGDPYCRHSATTRTGDDADCGRSAMRLMSLGAAMLSAAIALTAGAHADTTEIRISKGYGIHYLPLYVMQHDRLLEQAAQQAGLGDIKVTWPVIDGGNNINDAMLAGALDIASLGVPGFLTLWGKARSVPQYEVKGLAGIGAGS